MDNELTKQGYSAPRERSRAGDSDLIRTETHILGRACLQRSRRRRHRPGLKRSVAGA